jgi:hypothetical protein
VEAAQEWKRQPMIETSKHGSSVQMLIIYVAKKINSPAETCLDFVAVQAVLKTYVLSLTLTLRHI